MSLPRSLPSLAIEEVSLDILRSDRVNPRRIGDDELDALERSLRQFGFVQPVLARRKDQTVIGGHQRLVAARRLGMMSVPVTWLDISVERARLLSRALDKISGSWDDALLARLLKDLAAAPDIDLTPSGFGEDEVKEPLRSLETREKRERPESFNLDSALEEARRTTRTKPSDLWGLGEHRLLCGDSTRPEVVERLLAGRRAAMAFTDPPHNVAYDGEPTPSRRRRRTAIANDALDHGAWRVFVETWARPLLAAVDGAITVCLGSQEWPTVAGVLAETGGRWSDTIIRAEDHFVVGRPTASASTSRSGSAGARVRPITGAASGISPMCGGSPARPNHHSTQR